MTEKGLPLTGASKASQQWESIDWAQVVRQVKQLQMRIAKAVREERWGKVKSLQWLLTHSFSAKLLAVKRVTQNQGAKTAGVDNILWLTAEQKWNAANQLDRRGYKPSPLRRIYIPKSNGKQRPLGIPTMLDRAQQALYLLTLEPISETVADPNSYGFRPKRSAADATGQCFNALAHRHSSTWILEADIRACFDKINHQWMLNNLPIDKKMLNLWLKSGYIDKQVFHWTKEGTPQGGIISPTLMLMTLQGLETAIRQAAKPTDKVNVVIYADDFIVTGATKEVLVDTIKPVVIDFLANRGLELSKEKTFITHIHQGFNFLGFNIRKYQQKLLIKPAKGNVLNFLKRVRALIKSQPCTKPDDLIRLLNPKIRGWSNYYRHVVSKKAFSYVDYQIFQSVWQWCLRRHPQKCKRWVKRKYFRADEHSQWIFNGKSVDNEGTRLLDLFKASSIPICRHVKIVAKATPYDPAYIKYFQHRYFKARRGVLATGYYFHNLPSF